MKVIDRVLDVQGHVGGEKVGMTIDTSALAHIMSVLTDLYSDPELAVIREYSTNALDSHIEAGTTRPIEVTLPSPLSPFLRIRDYGVGLDGDGIRDIYSRYGTSTKRQSDDVVGMLGLGCKSALTYTDQFTLTGIKDGRMIQVLIGRDEDGAGSMTIVAEHDTDDLPGVEVTIPAKRHNEFESKAHAFFRFWTPGTVLVNGEQPERIDGQWITDSILITTDVDEDTVVMGNVPYPVADNPLSAAENGRRPYYQRDHTVAFVPIGAVQFTPSREALQMTKLTKDTLAALKTERDSRLDAALRASIEDAATPFEAIQTWRNARGIGLTGAPATYRGREVRSELARIDSVGRIAPNTYLVATPFRHSNYRLTGTWQGAASIEPNNIYFENFEGATFTATKRAKLDLYWARNGGLPEGTARYVFVPGRLTADERFWLEGAKIIDWPTVDSLKLPRDPSNPRKAGPRGAYKGRTAAGDWDKPILAENIDTTKPVLYWEGNRWSLQGSNEIRRGMIPENVLIVCLEANRVEKFKRDFPMAQSLSQYARQHVKKIVSGWDPYTLKAATFQRSLGEREINKLKKLSGVSDPAVTEAIALVTHKTEAIKDQLKLWDAWIEKPRVPVNPLDKYPLLASHYDLSGVSLRHAITYINAAHAAEGS